MRNHSAPAGLPRHGDGIERLRQRANLIGLDEDRVRSLPLYRLSQALGIGHKQVIPDKLHPAADLRLQSYPAIPVVLRQPVFNANYRVML